MTDQPETPVGDDEAVTIPMLASGFIPWGVTFEEGEPFVEVPLDAWQQLVTPALARLPLLERVVEAAREYGNAPRFSTRKETGFEVHTREVELFRPVIDALSLLDTQQETHG